MKETKLVVNSWLEELGVEKDWEDDLHLADVLDKHIFPQVVEAIQKAKDGERVKALEIARSCVINRKVGSPCPLVITEKMYEQVLKVGMMGVEALKKGSDDNNT